MTRKLTNNPWVDREVSNFLELLLQSGINFSKLILFGSRAKSTAKKWSDIDLAVVSDRDNARLMTTLLGLAGRVSDRIEVVAVSEDRFACKYDALAGEIKKYGKVVYENAG
jgi:predicted nucleotidyltransferase